MADTWQILLLLFFFFFGGGGLATRLDYKAVQILPMRFKYYKRVLNISNVFETFATCFKHLQRI